LIIDLPTDFKSDIIHRCEDHLNCNHHVQAVEGSLLSEITQNKNGVVNSNHHQAILQPAPGITISAYSSDGLPEAFEWSNPVDKPLLIAVQWHPERMDANNPYSTRLMQYFISEVVKGTKKR
jgi:putative glutamine amidotransferase